MSGKTILLNIGELHATKTPGDSLKTMALGSCVSVIFMDPALRIIAMAHVALPDSSVSREKAEEQPGRFADTAIPCLLKAMNKLGYLGNGKGLIVKLAGGAQVVDPNEVFNIGKRNILAIKKLLWERGMGVLAEDIGGTISRTVSVDVNEGKVLITSPHRDFLLL